MTDWTDYETLLDVNKLLSLFKPICYEIDNIQSFNNKYNVSAAPLVSYGNGIKCINGYLVLIISVKLSFSNFVL